MKNIFFDTEFIVNGNYDELVSIGIIKETGEEYYAITNEFDNLEADNWVKENVLQKLEKDLPRKNYLTIKKEIINFVGKNEKAQFWAYNASFDWYFFIKIFNTMGELPDNFENCCFDIKQQLAYLGIEKDELPKKPKNEHNALADARWNKQVFDIFNLGRRFF